MPARERPDVGAFGLYNGNWGGAKRNKAVLRHIGEDLIDGPAQIICAQEADQAVCEALQHGAFRSAATPAVAGDRRWQGMRGHEMGNPCMIAARVTAADSVRVLHWHRHYDGEHTARAVRTVKRVAYTRLLVAEVSWNHPLFGEKTARILCAHFHHLTAKRERFAAARIHFWDTLVDLCVRYGVRYIGGDFNMALYRVTGEARRRGLHVSLAASYAWRVTASDDVRYDSCGLFVVGPIRRTAPLLRPLHRADTTP
ncbi:MAG: hypothetical protein GY772_13685, partial [bacterium]|nr:hypothetical protein [bacterium]